MAGPQKKHSISWFDYGNIFRIPICLYMRTNHEKLSRPVHEVLSVTFQSG